MRPSHYRRRPDLTPRQREVIALMAEGRTNGEIGEQLRITLDGAKAHVREIMAKLEATSRQDAVQKWRSSSGSMTRLGRKLRGIVPAAALKWGLVGAAVVSLGVVVGAVIVLPGPGQPSSPSHPPNGPSMMSEFLDFDAVVTSDDPREILSALKGGGVLFYVSEGATLPNVPANREDVDASLVNETFVRAVLVDADGEFIGAVGVNFIDGELEVRWVSGVTRRSSLSWRSWRSSAGWQLGWTTGPYEAENLSELREAIEDRAAELGAAESDGSVERKTAATGTDEIISLDMPAGRTDFPLPSSIVFASEDRQSIDSYLGENFSSYVRQCQYYQYLNHGGRRTLEFQVRPGDSLPLHVRCIAEWPAVYEAWTDRQEWSVFTTDQWEAVVRALAPEEANELFE